MANKILLITSLLTMIESGNCPYKSSDPGIPGTELNMIHHGSIDQNLKDAVDPRELMDIHIKVQEMLDSKQYALGQFDDGQGNLYTTLVQNFEELQSETKKLTPSKFEEKMNNYKSSWCDFFKNIKLSFPQKIQTILSICGVYKLVKQGANAAKYIKDNLIELKTKINNLLINPDVRPSNKNDELKLAKQNITDAIIMKNIIDERVHKLLIENPHKENFPVPRFLELERQAEQMNTDELAVGYYADTNGRIEEELRWSKNGGKRKRTKRRKQITKRKTKRRKTYNKRRRSSSRKR